MSTGEAGAGQRPRTAEEEEFAKTASKCIKECNIEALITESKFLLTESLQQLVKHLVLGSDIDELRLIGGGGVGGKAASASKQVQQNPSSEKSSRATSPTTSGDGGQGGEDDEEVKDESAAIFFLELLVRTTIQNKDRVTEIWPSVSDHLEKLVSIASEAAAKRPFLLERSVNAVLRLSVRLARTETLASLVIQALSSLLTLQNNAMFHVARHVAFGLYELLRNNAANIHETEDWAIIFSMLEIVGAGASTLTTNTNDEGPVDDQHRVVYEEDSGHGASSESESVQASSRTASPTAEKATSNPTAVRERSGSIGSSSGGWIVLDKEQGTSKEASHGENKTKSNLIHFDPHSIGIIQLQL